MDKEMSIKTQSAQTLPVGQTPSVEEKDGETAAGVESALKEEDIALFLEHYGDVAVDSIPDQVWQQVERGISLTGAYALYENARLKAQLAASRQKEDGRRRTPGSLGDSLPEPDEFDRLWEE